MKILVHTKILWMIAASLVIFAIILNYFRLATRYVEREPYDTATKSNSLNHCSYDSDCHINIPTCQERSTPTSIPCEPPVYEPSGAICVGLYRLIGKGQCVIVYRRSPLYPE